MNTSQPATTNPATAAPPASTNPATVPQPAPVEAGFNQDDPQLKAHVADFISAAGGEALAKDPVVVPPNKDFDVPNPNDLILTEALVDTKAQPPSQLERNLFLKAILSESPIQLTIALFNDQLKVELRSRTVFEQRRVFDVLRDDEANGVISKEDMAYWITRMQQYVMILMVERVNGVTFSDAKLPDELSVEESKKILHAAVKKVTGMNNLRWTALFNAMRIFETKCATMNTEAANSDFWKPRE